MDSDQRPRVALVAHGVHDEGGMERACAELIRHHHREVRFVVLASELAPELRPLVERWIRVRAPLRPIPLKFVCFFVVGGFALRRIRVDIVHTIGAIVPNKVDLAGVHFCHAGHRATTGHFAPVGAPGLRRLNTTIARSLALLAERWCYRPSRLRALAAVSGGVRVELELHYPGVPITVTPNGVDEQRFRPDSGIRIATREQYGANEDCIALFIGGDWDHKGLAVAIEAVAIARADGASIALWVVGKGDQSRYEGLAASIGIVDAITFFGKRDDTERFYQAVDVFVLPSQYETFSIVCFEAASCGLPLIIPDISGARDLVGDGKAGLVVGRDASAVAAALVAMAADPHRRLKLGAEARRRAANFTWEASAASVAELYRLLLAEDRA